MNKNFWKFVGGFLGILLFAIACLWGFSYWQNYHEEQELRNLLRAMQGGEQNY